MRESCGYELSRDQNELPLRRHLQAVLAARVLDHDLPLTLQQRFARYSADAS